MKIMRFNRHVFKDVFRFFNHDYGVYKSPEVFLIRNTYIEKTGYYSTKDREIKRYIYVTFDYNMMGKNDFIFWGDEFEKLFKV